MRQLLPAAIVLLPWCFVFDCRQASAQTVVEIQDGQTLAMVDLEARVFQGQAFELGPETAFNVHAGGVMGPIGNIDALSEPVDLAGATINVLAGGVLASSPPGTPEPDRTFLENASVNLYEGGFIGDDFFGHASVHVTVMGGTLGDDVRLDNESILELRSGSFDSLRLDGGAVAFIADGSAFNITASYGSHVMMVGGALHDLDVSRGTALISGGTLARELLVTNDGVVDFTGGDLDDARISHGAILTMTGGRIGPTMMVDNAGRLVISGGEIGDYLRVTGIWSRISITGGTIGRGMDVSNSAQLFLEGGRLKDPVGLNSTSRATIVGSDFQRNGQPIVEFVRLRYEDYFSTTLADGSVHIFSLRENDRLLGPITLVESGMGPPDLTPIVVTDDNGPNGLRAGQHMTVAEGGVISDNFGVVSADVAVEGGSIGSNLEVLDGNVTVSTGSIGDGLDLFDGSTLVMTGGSLGSEMYVALDCTVEISGGRIGDRLRDTTFMESTITFIGSEFCMNGEPVLEDAVVTYSDRTLFTGTFADGSPFILSECDGDRLMLNLTVAPLDPPSPTMIVLDEGIGPNGLREGESISISGSAQLPDHFSAVSGAIQIDGGTTGRNLEVVYGTLHMTDGVIGDGLDIMRGTVATISGGSVGNEMEIFDDAELTLAGGTIGDEVRVRPDGTLHITGGEVGRGMEVDGDGTLSVSGGSIPHGIVGQEGSLIDISGGTLLWVNCRDGELDISGGEVGRASYQRESNGMITGGRIGALTASGIDVVELHGGEFLYNGESVSAMPEESESGDVLSGTLADGTVFLVPAVTGNLVRGAVLVETEIPPADLEPITVTTDGDHRQLRPDQVLTLEEGGSLPDAFWSASATLNVLGGALGDSYQGIDSTVIIDGGVAGSEFEAWRGSDVALHSGRIGSSMRIDQSSFTMTGGTVGESATFDESTADISDGVFEGGFGATESDMTISGGCFEDDVTIGVGSTLTIEGGEFLDRVHAQGSSELTIRGGTFHGLIDAWPSTTLTFWARVMRLDGEVHMLRREAPVTIDVPEGTLIEAILADGSRFEYVADFDEGVTIRGARTLIYCRCEFGGNPETIDITDLLGFIDLWLEEDIQADIDGRGLDITDVLQFLDCYLSAGEGWHCP